MSTGDRATREQVLAFRLEGHALSERQPADPLLAVAAACGVRNTPPGSAALALHARLASLPPAALGQALADRSLVELLSMRASPNVVPARDAAVFTLGALPAEERSLQAAMTSLGPILARAGMSARAALEQAVEAARAALAGGPLSRAALSEAMTRELPALLAPWCAACKAQHVHEMLFRLVGVRGIFAIVREGSQSLYTRTDQWLGAAPAGDGAALRAALLRRYLRCFGPSTLGHFAAWVGISVPDARPAWDALADRLVEVDVGGRRAWLHAEDRARLANPRAPTGVRLLPPYDAYLDQRDRDTLLPDAALHRRVWRAIGNPGAVLADGEIVGTWKSARKGKQLKVTVEAFAPLTATTRAAVEAEAALLAPHRDCATAAVAYAA